MNLEKKDLEAIRLFLPKKTGIKEAAIKGKFSTNHIYNVLAEKYFSIGVIKACLDVIEADAKEKEDFVKRIREDLEEKTPRV